MAKSTAKATSKVQMTSKVQASSKVETSSKTKAPAKTASPGALDCTFRAKIVKSPAAGGWTYVKMPGSADYFGTRGRVKIAGTVEGVAFESAFLALGDGTHKLPLKAALLKQIGKSVGDAVTVKLTQRLS